MPVRFKRRNRGPDRHRQNRMTGNRRIPTPEEITVIAHGDVSEEEIDMLRDRLRTVLAKIGEPVLLRSSQAHPASDPARARPVIAQALLDVNGDLVRAQVAAETPHVASRPPAATPARQVGPSLATAKSPPQASGCPRTR
jgi:hypothetical protein